MAFIGLSSRAKMVGGDVPFYVKIWPKLTHTFKTPITSQLTPLEQNRWFSVDIRS